jgi:hypothetical protein
MAAQSLRESGGFALGTQIWNSATLEKPIGKSFVANSQHGVTGADALIVG